MNRINLLGKLTMLHLWRLDRYVTRQADWAIVCSHQDRLYSSLCCRGEFDKSRRASSFIPSLLVLVLSEFGLMGLSFLCKMLYYAIQYEKDSLKAFLRRHEVSCRRIGDHDGGLYDIGFKYCSKCAAFFKSEK